MQLDLYPIIKPLLTNHHFLYIPGLGTFREMHIPAKEDTINGKMLPPDTTIVFEPGTSGDITPFLSEVKIRFSVDEEDAKEQIRLFSRQIHQALNMQQSVEIPNLGRLYYNLDHQISFVPRLKVFENTSFGLPEIPFKDNDSLTKTVVFENEQHVPPPVSPNPIGKFIFISLLFVLLSTGGYYLATTPFFIEKWADMRKIMDAWKEQKIAVGKTDVPVEIVTDDTEEVVDFPSDEEKDKANLLPENQEEVVKKQVVKIAIGVFGNPDNAARMVSKIEKAGFKSFTETTGNLTKVGVEQTYKSLAEKLEILEKVRSEVEKTAVIIN